MSNNDHDPKCPDHYRWKEEHDLHFPHDYIDELGNWPGSPLYRPLEGLSMKNRPHSLRALMAAFPLLTCTCDPKPDEPCVCVTPPATVLAFYTSLRTLKEDS